MAKPKPTPSPKPAPAPKPVVVKPPVAAKVVAPKITQSIASPFITPTSRPIGNFLPNNMSTVVPKSLAKPKPTGSKGSSTLDNYVYQKQMDLSKAKKIASDAAKKNAGRVPSTLENYVYQSQVNLSNAKKAAKNVNVKPAPKITKDRVERMEPPKKTNTTKTTKKKTTTTKKVTTKPPTIIQPPVIDIPEIEIPVIDPVPYTPPSIASSSPKPDTKPATPDLIMISDEAFPVELITDLLFEDIGGTEILNIARHDLVDGAELSYQQISNMAKVTTVSGGANLQSLTQTSEDLFSQFPLKRYQYVPASTDDPSGMNRNVYLNNNGDLVIELSGVDSSYQLEVSFQVGSVSDIIY